MQVFKAALRVFFRHPIYLAIYVLWLGTMGIFIGASLASTSQSVFTEERPEVAVIDRDESAFSQGLTGFIGEHSQPVTIADDERALQDATAQNQAAYIVIIPEGFGQDFIDAATNDTDAPNLETVVSYESYAGTMMDNLVNEYLNTVRTYVIAGMGDDQTQVTSLAASDLAQNADVSVWQAQESSAISPRYAMYMNYSVYTAMLAIIICVAVVMASFNREEVRKRDFSSATSSISMNLQLGLACLVIALIVWVWISGVGLIVFGHELTGANVGAVALGILSLLVFCMVSLALGFLIGQLTRSELVMNAAGNIIGLALSFMGGTWISLSLMGEPMATIARFTPTFYYGDALSQAFGMQSVSSGAARTTGFATYAGDLGIMALFAIAIFSIALAVGRAKRQTTRAMMAPDRNLGQA